MKCSKCENDSFRHLIFVLQCDKCGEIQSLPKDDTTGLDFLVQRYTKPTENNRPGEDIEFVVKTVKEEK
jgi:hypothetical protein